MTNDFSELKELENKFGTVEFKGKTYWLKAQAEMTNRLMQNAYHEASEGEEYEFEMSSDATDEEGNEYVVYWVFEDIKGEEIELDMYDYSDVDRVEQI